MAETLSTALPSDMEERITRLLKRACERDVRLATAESCTGGLLASLLTDVSGASRAFDRGFVTYTAEAKTELLGVGPDLIETEGVVSGPVARAMAEGALARSPAHIAVGITGYAGPTDEGEEGLVHLACAVRGRETTHRAMRFGAIGRGRTRLATLEVAVGMIEEALA